MIKRAVIFAGVFLLLLTLAMGQNSSEKSSQPAVTPAAAQLADELAQRLAKDLHIKTVIGEPVTVGAVTLIPIIMIDVSFGGGVVGAVGNPSAAPSQNAAPGMNGFVTRGEARPLGFVAISPKGVRFISLGQPASQVRRPS